MESTRRDVLTAAVTLAGATATHDLAHADDHAHSEVPSDVALRVKSLEIAASREGARQPGGARCTDRYL